MTQAFKGGIYQITNTKNSKKYIGSAINLQRRISDHKYLLKKGTHHNPVLQAGYNKHGMDVFIFEVLATCLPQYLIILEQSFIDKKKPKYNINPVAGSQLGAKRTKASKKKMSGRTFTKEQRDQISKSLRENGNLSLKGVKSAIETNKKPVYKYSLEGKLIKEFKSNKAAAASIGFTRLHLERGRPIRGYIWSYDKLHDTKTK